MICLIALVLALAWLMTYPKITSLNFNICLGVLVAVLTITCLSAQDFAAMSAVAFIMVLFSSMMPPFALNLTMSIGVSLCRFVVFDIDRNTDTSFLAYKTACHVFATYNIVSLYCEFNYIYGTGHAPMALKRPEAFGILHHIFAGLTYFYFTRNWTEVYILVSFWIVEPSTVLLNARYFISNSTLKSINNLSLLILYIILRGWFLPRTLWSRWVIIRDQHILMGDELLVGIELFVFFQAMSFYWIGRMVQIFYRTMTRIPLNNNLLNANKVNY